MLIVAAILGGVAFGINKTGLLNKIKPKTMDVADDVKKAIKDACRGSC